MLRLALVSLFACGAPPSEAPKDPPPTPTEVAPATTCTADGECNLVDQRCVAAPGDQPDACVCFEGRCALRPSGPRISKQACETSGDCVLDVATAQCAPGIAGDEFRGRYVGPTCWCVERACQLHWFDPTPCSSDDDCWVADKPVLHAIARPPRLKGRKFRGCVDGESVPACAAGRCTLRGLKC